MWTYFWYSTIVKVGKGAGFIRADMYSLLKYNRTETRMRFFSKQM